jgi:hypothetical protein
VELWISHFSNEIREQARVSWVLKAGDTNLTSGMLEPVTIYPGEVTEVGQCTFSVPDLDAPIHATFEAMVVGTNVANAWDLWLFPQPEKKKVDGMAVTEDLFEVLSTRYHGLVKTGTEAAKAVRLVVGSWDHPDLLESIRQGKRGIMIGPAEGKPNIELGWWLLGDQVGTTFARHPVFGDFPHNGKLSPLWFRLIKRGLPLPIDPQQGDFEYFAVGEGQTQYFAYVLEKTGQDGEPLLMTYGVDVLAETPEGAYLLDAMITYTLFEQEQMICGKGGFG